MYELIEKILEIACPLYSKEEQRVKIQDLLERYTQDLLADGNRIQADVVKSAGVARRYATTNGASFAVDQEKVQIAFRSWSDPIYEDGDDGEEFIGEANWAVISGKAAHMRQLFPEDSLRYTSDELEYVVMRPWTCDEVRAFLSQKGYEVEV